MGQNNPATPEMSSSESRNQDEDPTPVDERLLNYEARAMLKGEKIFGNTDAQLPIHKRDLTFQLRDLTRNYLKGNKQYIYTFDS